MCLQVISGCIYTADKWLQECVDELPLQAKDWVNKFLALGDRCEGFQRRSITPYVHIMVYHVPSMLRRFGNLKQFSGQG